MPPGSTPVIQHALGNPVTTGDNRHLAAFGFHLGQQCLLLRRPLPTALNPRNDLNVCQSRLPLELREGHPSGSKSRASRRPFPYAPDRPLTARLSPEFDQLYSLTGRPPIPPEQLLRAL